MIHIKRTRAIGDVIWTEPIVRHFTDQGKRVNIVTHYPEIFENYPSEHLVINEPIFQENRKKADSFENRFVDLDMAYEENPKMHILQAYQKQALIQGMDLCYPKLHLSKEEQRSLFSQDYAVLHLERNSLNFRNVYGIDWQEVVGFLQKLGLIVLQISHIGKDTYGQWVQTESLRKIMSVIYNSKLFIGLDSGPSHIAASLGIPSILFFGSVNPRFRHLHSFNGIILQSPCPSAHCYHEVISHRGQPCRFVNHHEAPPCCIQSTGKVLEAIDSLSKSNHNLKIRRQNPH